MPTNPLRDPLFRGNLNASINRNKIVVFLKLEDLFGFSFKTFLLEMFIIFLLILIENSKYQIMNNSTNYV